MASVLGDHDGCQLAAHLHGTVLRNVLRDVKTRDSGVIHGHLHGGVPGILEDNNGFAYHA